MHLIQSGYTHTIHHFSYDDEKKAPFLHVFAVMYAFKLSDPATLIPMAEVLKVANPYLENQHIALDEGFDKPSAEFLVYGKNVVENPLANMQTVEVTVGEVHKALGVYPKALWHQKSTEALPESTLGRALARYTLTYDKTLESVPLNWQSTYGGNEASQNPLGLGAVVDLNAESWRLAPLRNINSTPKDPHETITPVSFAAIPMYFKLRNRYLGKARLSGMDLAKNPSFPKDTDPHYFQMASSDQWLNGDLKGVSFNIKGLSKTPITGKVPSIYPRVHAIKVEEKGANLRLQEIKGKADTLTLFPNDDCGILTTRFLIESARSSLSEFTAFRIELSDTPETRTEADILTSAKQRLDEKSKHFYGLKEGDLLPAALSALKKDSLAENLEQKMAGLTANMMAALDAFDQPHEAHLETKRATDDATCDSFKDDEDDQKTKTEVNKDRQMLENPKDKTLDYKYRENIHYYEAKEQVSAKGAMFEKVIFTTPKLNDLNADEASFENSDFNDVECHNSRFEESRFIQCNFNRVTFENVHLKSAYFRGCHFTDASFNKINLDKARFEDCTFTNTTFTEVSFKEAVFQGLTMHTVKMNQVAAEGALFYKGSLNKLTLHTNDFKRSQWTSLEIYDLNARHIDLTQASFDRIEFKNACFNAARFEKTGLHNSITWYQSTLTHCQIDYSNCAQSTWEASTIQHCSLTQVNFLKSEFESLKLLENHCQQTNFSQATLSEGVFIKNRFDEVSFLDFITEKSTMSENVFNRCNLAYSVMPEEIRLTKTNA